MQSYELLLIKERTKQKAKDIYLATSVRVAKDIGLSKVTMRCEDYNIENHWDPAEEFLEGARIRSFKKVKK